MFDFGGDSWQEMASVLVPALALGLVVQCCFLRTLAVALRRCSPPNRSMPPGQVWLNLIPLFGAVWMFVTVARVADSLKAEFAARGRRAEHDFGRGSGFAYLILSLLGLMPVVGRLFSIGAFVYWVLYWRSVGDDAKALAGGRRLAEQPA